MKKAANPSCSGNIINIGSISSFIVQPSFIPYNTSKGAILQLTRCLAMDVAPYSIRVNAVCPSGILTPATTRHSNHEKKSLEEVEKELSVLHLIPRLGKPEEVQMQSCSLRPMRHRSSLDTHLWSMEADQCDHTVEML